jgi:hypothetical protein
MSRHGSISFRCGMIVGLGSSTCLMQEPSRSIDLPRARDVRTCSQHS